MFFKNKKLKQFTEEDFSFLTLKNDEYEIPISFSNHPGGYGFKRKNHTHEGVDLYVEENTEVLAIENGVIIDIGIFTGEEVLSPWWNRTEYVAIKTNDYVYLYGEIEVSKTLKINKYIEKGEVLGKIIPVLKEQKNNRPLNMLHFELYQAEKYKGPLEFGEDGLLDPLTVLKDFKVNSSCII